MKAVKKIWIMSSLMLFISAYSIGQKATNTSPFYFKIENVNHLRRLDSLQYKSANIQILKDKKNEKMPLFCRWEASWYHTSGLNLCMRVGTLHEANILEGKN